MGCYKTKKKHYKRFKRACRFWAKEFGLVGWRLYYAHSGTGNKGNCCTSISGRCATITLSKEWFDVKPTKREVERCAFHEVGELLVARMVMLAKDRFADEWAIDEEKHALIRTLEEVCFEARRAKRGTEQRCVPSVLCRCRRNQ